MQTVRSGVIYAVGSFSAQMRPAEAVSLASTWVRTYWRSVRSWLIPHVPFRAYVLGLLKAKRASVPTQTSSTELIIIV